MHVLIAGIRGVPAAHGGFETFAEDLALYLTERGHMASVFCQCPSGETSREDFWHGVRRIIIPAPDGPLGTVLFDWRCVKRALRETGVVLTLGSNTGMFSFLYRLSYRPNVMNMDGMEWKRDKWSMIQRIWLRLNEIAGATASDHLVADHPEISRHLERYATPEKITMIPYGAVRVSSGSTEPIYNRGLEPKQYFVVIARPEPENSLLEIVRGHSQGGVKTPLVILGNYDPQSKSYHRQVMEAARKNVQFVGAIYDKEEVRCLRYHAKAYIHGHRVGGTNPSLVESLGAGNAVIAHDNPFNRWVAGQGARYFNSADELARILRCVEDSHQILEEMAEGSRDRHAKLFRQEMVLPRYEELLRRSEKRSAECSRSTNAAEELAEIQR